MTRFHASELSGIIPPMITPLGSTGAVDAVQVHDHVEFLLEAGVHGIFVVGSTGEAVYLDADQRMSVISATAEAVAGRVPVLAGAIEMTSGRALATPGTLANSARTFWW